MDKKSVSSKSEINQEQKLFEPEFEWIEDSLRKLRFIREGFSNLDEGEEDMWAEMIEGVLPGIVGNLECGIFRAKRKIIAKYIIGRQTVPQTAINTPVSAVKGLYTTVQGIFLLREGGRQGISKKEDAALPDHPHCDLLWISGRSRKLGAEPARMRRTANV
jgi:hypothetical protein